MVVVVGGGEVVVVGGGGEVVVVGGGGEVVVVGGGDVVEGLGSAPRGPGKPVAPFCLFPDEVDAPPSR